VSAIEYQILGDIFLMIVLSLFGLALPFYWWMRKSSPERGWNFGGNVSTVGLQSYDLLGVGAVICFIALTWKVQGAFVGKAMPAPQSKTVLASALTYLSIAAIVPACLFWRTSLQEYFGLRWSRPWHLFWIIPLLMLTMAGASELADRSGWKEWVDGIGGGRQVMVDALTQTNDIRLIIVMGFAVILAAPVAEELIFRGYLYPVVKRFTERNFATIFTGALFGMAHMNLLGLPLLILFGMAMAVIYERTGSIWAPIICHMAFNGWQFYNMLRSEAGETAYLLGW